ncbi:CLUMA_CG021104, isoform A [Clunio marinus]|uniref:CLUMA_CG021104, isoform A n=1 Tax=Clunio marinus TaxID=568069 RepID=A0A1J1J7V1_9DIPT|nr:CLUMA_CG021104, isoform A [Clunio marinus]
MKAAYITKSQIVINIEIVIVKNKVGRCSVANNIREKLDKNANKALKHRHGETWEGKRNNLSRFLLHIVQKLD